MGDGKMKQRQAGLDIVRCLGLLFVVGVHSFLKNGFYNQPQTGGAIWLADSARWLFYCCNGIFMMLTGYLKSTKPLEKGYFQGLKTVLIGYFLTCVVSFPVRHFLLGEKLSFAGWMEKLVTFSNYAWYVEMYIGLILISPGINMVLERMDTPKKQQGMLAVMLLLTAFPSVTAANVLPDYWTALYPITYYMIGGMIRRLQPKMPFGVGMALISAVAMMMGGMSLISTDSGFSDGFSQGYGGFWVTGLTTLVFLTFYRVQPGKTMQKIAAWAADGCFEGYILSRLLDVWVYELVKPWHTPEKYPLIFLCVTIPVFLFAVVAGKCVHVISVWLSAGIGNGRKRRAKV